MADGHFSRLRKGVVNGHAQKQQHFVSVLYEGVYPFPDDYVGAMLTDKTFGFFSRISKKHVRIMFTLDRDTCGDMKEHMLGNIPYIPGEYIPNYTWVFF